MANSFEVSGARIDATCDVKKDPFLKDVVIPDKIDYKKHEEFLVAFSTNKNEYEYVMTEYLRMSGIYWGLTALDLMGKLGRVDQQEVLDFVSQCYDGDSGGYGASIGHDPHILYTLSAVQILALYNKLDTINADKVSQYVLSLQQEDGSFCGDKWGEVDTRFSFCAVATLALLKKLEKIDERKTVDFIVSCKNFDEGFGTRPGSETHAGQIYCCVGALSILGYLHELDADVLGAWLSDRQCPCGGLNGRPEKLPDVCYSWWVLASLKIIGRLSWIHKDQLKVFIRACQDDETGGISDRPGDMPDPFHTLFGLAGISLLGGDDISGSALDTETLGLAGVSLTSISLKPINPVFCLPTYVIDRLGITTYGVE